MTAPVLLAASCVLAWAFTEPGADRIESVLPDAYITAINMAEVIAKLDRLGAPGMTFAQDLVSAGLTVVLMAGRRPARSQPIWPSKQRRAPVADYRWAISAALLTPLSSKCRSGLQIACGPTSTCPRTSW